MSLGLAIGRTPPESGCELSAPVAHGFTRGTGQTDRSSPAWLCWLERSPTGGIDSCRAGFKYFEVIPILDSRLS